MSNANGAFDYLGWAAQDARRKGLIEFGKSDWVALAMRDRRNHSRMTIALCDSVVCSLPDDMALRLFRGNKIVWN